VPCDHQIRHPNCPAAFVETLSGVFGPAFWVENSVHWKSAAGPVKATVHALEFVTEDGRHVQGAISVVQELHLASPELAQAIVARHNCEPGLGAAFAVERAPDTAEVVSRVTWYRDEEAIRDKLALSLAIAVLVNMTASLEYGAGPRLPPLPHHDQPSRWSEQDLNLVAEQMHDLSCHMWIDGSNLVARFPEGLLCESEDSADLTLVVSTECIHSSLGNGLAMEVSYYLDLPAENASKLVRRLNRMEADSIAGPPLLGAWVLSASDPRLAFRSFFPNLAFIPGLLNYVVTWQMQRLELAGDALMRFGKRWMA
jgi:hypothetical protein